MADGRVAGHGFNLAHRRAMRPSRQRLFRAAMLITERNFQMQHFLAVALKTKMARLNYAGVNRPDGDFVNFTARHFKKFPVCRMVVFLPAHGFQPRMTFRHQSVLLPNFALEQMRLRLQQRQRRITFRQRLAPPHRQRVVGVERQHGKQADAGIFRHAQPRAQTRSVIQFRGGGPNQFRHRPRGHVRPRNARGVGQKGE